ncbi:MAG: YfiR/HmsC family protein [Colwellia sp.]|nr:YfiR/HmsC family protein [Colwellia sp.]MCW8864770.1 YfiR/HmsC family protein [Colwellia sp.]MCW9081859.1 YfiR/HmsC family protein [Colwellia sp.]
MITAHYKSSIMILIVSVVLLFNNTTFSQQLSKEQVKVAYLYNFLKHITWPDEHNKKQFVIAVYRDADFYALLVRSFNNKRVSGKDINLVAISDVSQARAADLLYIPSQFNNKLAQIAAQVRSSQTLLVTDNSADKHNAMVNLIDSDNNAISFEINQSNIIYEKLKTSPQLLLLGGTELDIASLYRETEQAMQQTRERESTLNATLAIQQAKIKSTNQKLSQLNAELARSSQEINQQQLAMQKKEQELAFILQQLSEANKNFGKQTQAISEKKQQVAAKEQENQQMANLIKQNKIILQEQQQNINNQQQALNIQNDELAAQQQTIVEQKTTITITSILIIFVALVLILLVGLFLKNKKTTRKLSVALAHLEETQNQLIQSEKMASLGKLIAGVAHEINTPLGIAVTSTSLIQENTEEIAKKLNNKTLSQRQLQSFINIVSESSVISNKGLERVIQLMHNFKEVAADQIVEEMRKINLADYIDEVMTTLASELKKNKIAYQYKGECDLAINTIPGALAQVVTNLVNNSIRHGFDTDNCQDSLGNRITISLEQNSHDEVCLTYQDNGKGMDEKTLLQVFDPFFTTKRNKGGTGLGMNIVFNIVEQKLNGHIEMQSSLGEGVICTITLPLLTLTV